MSMNGLKQFITNVRQSSTKNDEFDKINNQLRIIYKQLKDPNNSDYLILQNICQLMYIKSSGYELSVLNLNGVGYEISQEEIRKFATEQCLKLIKSPIIADNDKVNDLNDILETRGTAFLALKKLFARYLKINELELIINNACVDINSIVKYEQSEHFLKLKDTLWTIIGNELQDIGEIFNFVDGEILDKPFMKDFTTSLFQLLNHDDQDNVFKKYTKPRLIMCIVQLFKLNHKGIEKFVSTRDNLALVGKTFAQTSLSSPNIIISLCKLLDQWIKFDWEGIKSLEGLFITKISEIIQTVKSIQSENDKKQIKNYDWILKYGYVTIALLNTLRNITTVKSDSKISQLNNHVTFLINNCIGIRAKIFNEVEPNNSKYQLLNANVLLTCLSLYTNNIGKEDGLNSADTGVVIDSVVSFIKFNTNLNVRFLYMKKLLEILENNNNLGNGRTKILNEFNIWRKFIRDKDTSLKNLTCKILIQTLNTDKTGDENITFSQIKEVVIILLYHLQACEYMTRGEILSEILTILENYKESGIIQETARKVLRVLITIGNYEENSFERAYKLIEYATSKMNGKDSHNDIIITILEFICKALTVGCCENFIKLSLHVFLKNLKDWKAGDLSMQLKLIIEKYETASISTKLLILDVMSSFYNIIEDENMKDLIQLAFEQESEHINIAIRQRAFEYSMLIKHDIKLDLSITIDSINSLPQLIPPKIKDKGIILTEGWENEFLRFLKFDQGILYNKDGLKVIYKVKKEKNIGFVSLTYKLKEGTESKVKCLIIEDSYNDSDLKINGIVKNDNEGTMNFNFALQKMYSCEKEPVVSFAFDDTIVNLKLSLCLKTLHTSEGKGMSLPVFQSRWSQLGNLSKESGSIGQMSYKSPSGKSAEEFIKVASRYLKNVNFEVVATEIESNEGFSIMCGSLLCVQSITLGVLMVVTVDSIEIRCTNPWGGPLMICERVVPLLESI